MICASICEPEIKDFLSRLSSERYAEVIEARVDYLKSGFGLEEIIKSASKPLIVTCRKKGEFGRFAGSENERISILEKAASLGAAYIDIELCSGKGTIRYLKDKGSRIIVSYHDVGGTKNIFEAYNNIKRLSPDIIKVVTHADSALDNFAVFDLLETAKKENKKLIAFCTGSYGEFSRVLCRIFGSFMTYGSAEKGRESAEGQITAKDMREIYRLDKLNDKTKIYGLIGNPVEHSLSHLIHNEAFELHKINAVYVKFLVESAELGDFIRKTKKMDIGGFSVTLPYKTRIMGLLDKIDKDAEKIGAVNTITVKDGKLIGYNTDCDGAIEAIKQESSIEGKKVVVLGAGGAARAIAYGVLREKGNLTILNRTVEKANSLANEFGCCYGKLKLLQDIDFDILVNATSAGMYPDVSELPLPQNVLSNALKRNKNAVVLDTVFNPAETKLLKEVKRYSCTAISGIEMLTRQAALQFKLWTGKGISPDYMKMFLHNYLDIK